MQLERRVSGANSRVVAERSPRSVISPASSEGPLNLRASAIRHRRDLCARRYTETENNVIGLVHLTDAATAPRAAGTLPCPGEPRAVAFYNDDLLLAAILTSDDYVRTSGVLRVLRWSLFPDAYSYSYSYSQE